jgi:hypothetical protein
MKQSEHTFHDDPEAYELAMENKRKEARKHSGLCEHGYRAEDKCEKCAEAEWQNWRKRLGGQR